MLRGSLRQSESLSSPTKEAAASASLQGGVSLKRVGGGTVVHRIRGFSGGRCSPSKHSHPVTVLPPWLCIFVTKTCERLIEEEE